MNERRVYAALSVAIVAGSLSVMTLVTTASHVAARSPASSKAEHTVFLPIAFSHSAAAPEPITGIIADHRVVDRFDSIPNSAIQAAGNLRAYQRHASTGNAVSSQGLNYLQGTRDPSPYPDYQYDRRNWTYEWWPSSMDKTFRAKVDNFVQTVTAVHANYDVLGMKLCYQDWYGLDFAYYRDRMLNLERTYPNKTFIWWTQPIREDWSTQQPDTCAKIQTYNNSIRAYARANNKPLIDIADIESHDPSGASCSNTCETKCYPDYGDNPHPNPTLAIRVGKAYWWAMARLAGWSGN